MNISKVVSTLKRQNGLYGITLPFKNEETGEPIPTETVIREVIAETTVPMYSQFVPWLRIGDCDVKNLKCVDKRNNIYMLPTFLTLTPIMYVSDVRMPTIGSRGTYGDISPAGGIARTMQGVYTANAYMMVAGQMRSEPTFNYEGFNKIKLIGFPKTVLTFEVAAEHLPNLESVEDSCYDSFMQLARLDLGEFLWNNLRNYNPIQTAHGEYQLPIQQWEGASEAREQLLERWRDVYHVDMDWTKFM